MKAAPKKKPGRSKKYLAFIRTKPCCLCRAEPAEAHHTDTGGEGMKGSDYSAVPLCRQHHRLLHNVGKKGFTRRFKESMADCLVEWCEMEDERKQQADWEDELARL